jgi:ATP-binding cassette, subfamily B, bacterial
MVDPLAYWPPGAEYLLYDSPAWIEHRSGRFVLHYQLGALSERVVERLGSRLERLHAAAIAALETEDDGAPIDVFMTESSDEPLGEPQDGESATRRIRGVYRPDAPDEAFDRALIELLLSEWLAGQAALPVFVDGLLGVATQRAQGHDPSRVDSRLYQHLRDGRWPSLAGTLGGPPPGEWPLYYQAVTSLMSFLLSAYSVERLREFGRRLETGSAESAIEATYGKSLPVLEKQWQASITEAERKPLGLFGFWPAIWPYMRPFWPSLLLILATLFAYRSPQLFSPAISKVLIDQGLTPRDATVVTVAIAALVGLVILQAIGNLAKEYLGARVGSAIMNSVRRRMFDQLQRLSLGFYVRSRSGDLASRLSSDLAAIESGLIQYIPLTITLAMGIMVSLVILFVADWRLALISLSALVLLLAIPRFLGRPLDEAGFDRRRVGGELASFEQENLTAQPAVKAFGLHQRQRTSYERLMEATSAATVRVGRLSGFYGGAITGVGAVAELLTMAVGAYLVFTGNLTLGVLVLFLQQIGVIVHNLQAVHWVIHPLQDASGGMQRVEDLLREGVEIVDVPGARPLAAFAQQIRFRDVTFSYTGEQVNLDRVSLAVPAGQSVALVGASGSGKSTLLSLLMRFYDPVDGDVTIDGQDVRQVTQSSLRSQIAVVLQDTFVFNASIRENIRLGRLEATDEEVEGAARAAELHDFIEGLPQGYDTVVGERGGRLSGGQRQRIAIARALLRNPRILLLDEPTSALDARSEAAINATLREVAHGRTVLMVTHRLTAAVDSDRIVVFDAGRVVEEGTHEELLEREGHYYRLWQQQHGFVVSDLGERVTVEPERLAMLPLFKRLDPTLLADLSDRFATEQYDTGSVLFEPSDPSDKLYMVLRGAVEILQVGPSGDERPVAVRRDGEHFGEVALRRGTTRGATARIMAPTTLLVLEREQVVKGISQILELPKDQRGLITWLARHRDATAADVAAHLDQDEASARAALVALVEQGYVQMTEIDGESRYQPRLGRRRGSRLRPEIWRTLESV